MVVWHAIVMCDTHNNNRQGGGDTRAKWNETKWETTEGDTSAESWALANELQQGIVGSARGKTKRHWDRAATLQLDWLIDWCSNWLSSLSAFFRCCFSYVFTAYIVHNLFITRFSWNLIPLLLQFLRSKGGGAGEGSEADKCVRHAWHLKVGYSKHEFACTQPVCPSLTTCFGAHPEVFKFFMQLAALTRQRAGSGGGCGGWGSSEIN